jgi:hypothetical protein
MAWDESSLFDFRVLYFVEFVYSSRISSTPNGTAEKVSSVAGVSMSAAYKLVKLWSNRKY